MFAWACLELVINNMIKTKIAIMYLLFKKKTCKKGLCSMWESEGSKIHQKI